MPTRARNLRSVFGMEEVVRAKIAKEAQAGRVLGPFSSLPLPNLQISPLGVVPKKAPGEFRLIHLLSYLSGGSVNDSIPQDLCSVRYASPAYLYNAIRILRDCGLGALMAKTDIKSAFRFLLVHPGHFCLLGFEFEGGLYLDRALLMGLSISCWVFEQFSSMLDWGTRWRAGLSSMVHYLYDFLPIGRAGMGQCAHLLRGFEAMCRELGVLLVHTKTEGPTTK